MKVCILCMKKPTPLTFAAACVCSNAKAKTIIKKKSIIVDIKKTKIQN